MRMLLTAQKRFYHRCTKHAHITKWQLKQNTHKKKHRMRREVCNVEKTRRRNGRGDGIIHFSKWQGRYRTYRTQKQSHITANYEMARKKETAKCTNRVMPNKSTWIIMHAYKWRQSVWIIKTCSCTTFVQTKKKNNNTISSDCVVFVFQLAFLLQILWWASVRGER